MKDVIEFMTNEFVLFFKNNENFKDLSIQDKTRAVVKEMFSCIYEETKFSSEAEIHAEADTKVFFNLLEKIDKGEL